MTVRVLQDLTIQLCHPLCDNCDAPVSKWTIALQYITIHVLSQACPAYCRHCCQNRNGKHFLDKQWQTKYAKNKNKNSKLSSPVPGPSGTAHKSGIAALGKLL